MAKVKPAWTDASNWKEMPFKPRVLVTEAYNLVISGSGDSISIHRSTGAPQWSFTARFLNMHGIPLSMSKKDDAKKEAILLAIACAEERVKQLKKVKRELAKEPH